MSIAGQVSRAMLSRYSHVRMEAKRRALDGIALRQGAADEKRKAEAEHPPRSSDPAFSSVQYSELHKKTGLLQSDANRGKIGRNVRCAER